MKVEHRKRYTIFYAGEEEGREEVYYIICSTFSFTEIKLMTSVASRYTSCSELLVIVHRKRIRLQPTNRTNKA